MLRHKSFFLGLIYPLGFAPFHYSSVLYLSLLFFIHQLYQSKHIFKEGYLFGTGLALVGTSWIYNSIYQYGHLPPPVALTITCLFIIYVATFYGLLNILHNYFIRESHVMFRPLITAAVWTLCEFIRAQLFGGFPWLLLGFSVLDTSLQHLLPWFGVYAPGFIMILALSCLAHFQSQILPIIGVSLFLIPQYLPLHFNSSTNPPIHVAMIQGNVKMQDKWNEDVFWKQFNYYSLEIMTLLKPQQVIILPEAAISVPSSFLRHEISVLNQLALKKDTALIIGIPQPSAADPENYHNGIMALGKGSGTYFKQQLVPFGEFIPHVFQKLMKYLNIPMITTIPGQSSQRPIQIFKQSIASLICYEIAYPELLRRQLPQAKWIVSQSDDGWFGHSLALFQHLQMAQTLSLMSHREQAFVNNNGLSSLIDANGHIIAQIPAWHRRHLQGEIHQKSDITPWMQWGDRPMLFLVFSIIISAVIGQILTRLLKKNQSAKPATIQS